MDASRKTPWIASDIKRGYLILAIAVPLSIVLPIAIVLLGGPRDRESLAVATLFLSWTSISVLATLMTFVAFGRTEPSEFRHWLVATTPRGSSANWWYALNGGGAASWAITGSFIAVAAVAILSFTQNDSPVPLLVYSGIAVVVSSLFMTITAYSVRYAREWATAGGFEFAGDAKPGFMDFFYLAVQVATTFSTSDVTVTTTKARRLVTANSLISFTFNTVTVALLVSVLISSTA